MKLNYFNCLRFLRWSLLSLFLVVSAGQAKVYSNIQIAAYGEDRSFHLEQCQSKTFLNFMEELVYPAIKGDAVNRTGGEHIDAVKEGEGIEIRLTDNVSTYHVKYKAAEEENSERAGRSFAAVGFKKKGTVAKYLADASDSYYLSSLEEVGGDADQLRLFYDVIMRIMTRCDASGLDDLGEKTQQVAADFIAVLVAEQYRHLTGGDGELGSRFNWDDALLQVTLLASFHSGQTDNDWGMFLEKQFTNQVFDQSYPDYDEDGNRKKNKYGKPANFSVYQQYRDPRRVDLEKRDSQLNDYWQQNPDCSRSGINKTRRDFTLMGTEITQWLRDNKKTKNLNKVLTSVKARGASNVFQAISTYLINDDTPTNLGRGSKTLVKGVVDLLMEIRENAVDMTQDFAAAQAAKKDKKRGPRA